MTLAEKMLWYRAEHDLTQQQFADMCGLSKMTICQIETGVQKPSKITQMKILIVLGGNTSEVINKQDKSVQSLPQNVSVEVCGESGTGTESGSVGDGQ